MADLDAIHLEAHSRRLPMKDPGEAFEEAAGQTRVLWRQEDTVWLGIGTAIRLHADGPDRIQDIQDQADQVSQRIAWPEPQEPWEPRWFGGISFHPDHQAAPPWQGFDGAVFWLPRQLLTWHDGELHETVLEGDEEPAAVVDDAAPAPAPEDLDQQGWTRAIKSASVAITSGQVSKVVLARSRHSAPWPARLPQAHDRPDGAGFHLEPVPGHMFFGQSPERLVRLRGDLASTHAVAGSAPRGEDEALGAALQQSQKDTLEHELVVSFIRDRLAHLGAEETARHPRRIMQLPTIQHLETPIEARVPPGTHILRIVAALHPTPAVAGSPRAPSLELISKLEPFPRGWYAGAVGWFDLAGQGDFQVALRSALTTPEATWRFAGAGIVAGSDPDQEWQETEWKLAALGRDEHE